MPALVSVSPSKAKDKPSETKKTPPASPVKDAERLSSETKRLLLRHSEHALTLSELVESFRESRDPARPTAEMLYKSLSEYNTRTAGGQRFEVRNFVVHLAKWYLIHTHYMYAYNSKKVDVVVLEVRSNSKYC